MGVGNQKGRVKYGCSASGVSRIAVAENSSVAREGGASHILLSHVRLVIRAECQYSCPKVSPTTGIFASHSVVLLSLSPHSITSFFGGTTAGTAGQNSIRLTGTYLPNYSRQKCLFAYMIWDAVISETICRQDMRSTCALVLPSCLRKEKKEKRRQNRKADKKV